MNFECKNQNQELSRFRLTSINEVYNYILYLQKRQCNTKEWIFAQSFFYLFFLGALLFRRIFISEIQTSATRGIWKLQAVFYSYYDPLAVRIHLLVPASGVLHIKRCGCLYFFLFKKVYGLMDTVLLCSYVCILKVVVSIQCTNT